jgi:Mg2+-importing ATPase
MSAKLRSQGVLWKSAGAVAPDVPLGERTNGVFLGTNVRSGIARCLIVRTGSSTELGAIAERLTTHPPETEFDRGIKHFGYLLTSAMLVLVLVLFAAHVFLGRAPLETLLFSVALAVGLSPELLPAILSVNLARGASMMAHRGVLVRRQCDREPGSMDVLFTDKTGTLTEGIVKVEGAYNPGGAPARSVLDLAACNAALETGLANPLDDALLEATTPNVSVAKKLAEIPFDFTRKRVTVVVERATAWCSSRKARSITSWMCAPPCRTGRRWTTERNPRSGRATTNGAATASASSRSRHGLLAGATPTRATTSAR